MLDLKQIENDLVASMKAKDQMTVEVLRGLKTRIQNEQVAKMVGSLAESDIFAVVRSEIKRRKEAAESFKNGGRTELSEKELLEAGILEKYLPAQMSEADILQIIEQVLKENPFTASEFGKAMGMVKGKVGVNADSAVVAKLLKEKLK